MHNEINQPPVSPKIAVNWGPGSPVREGWRELLRYDPVRDELVPADGKPGIAFVGLSETGWPYMVASSRLSSDGVDAPVNRAMRLGSGRYGACNGRRVDAAGEYVL